MNLCKRVTDHDFRYDPAGNGERYCCSCGVNQRDAARLHAERDEKRIDGLESMEIVETPMLKDVCLVTVSFIVEGDEAKSELLKILNAQSETLGLNQEGGAE